MGFEQASATATGGPPREPRRQPAFAAAVGLTAAAGVFANVVHVGRPSALFDEQAYATAGWLTIHRQLGPVDAHSEFIVGANNEHPPLAKYFFGLAQMILHRPEQVVADRLVAVLCTGVTAALIGLLVARVAGRWTGLLTAALTLLLPESVAPQTTRFARAGQLEPIAEMFVAASLGVVYLWWRSDGSRRWMFAFLTGLAVGCATGSKENAFLGVVGPMALLVASRARRGWAAGAGGVCEALLATAVGATVFVALYLPLGHPFSRIHYLLTFQSTQSRHGHLVGLDHMVTPFPPWWANLWWAGHGIGLVAAWVLAAAAVAGTLLRRDRLVLLLLAAMTGPVAFHCFISGVALPFYWTLWEPPVLALGAIGMSELLRRRRRPVVALRAASLVAALVASVVLFLACGSTLRAVAGLRVVGPAAIPGVFRDDRVTGPVGDSGVPRQVLAAYFPQLFPAFTLQRSAVDWQAVILAQPACRTPLDQGVRALVTANVAAGRLRQVYNDAQIRLFVADGPLLLPTRGQVAAQPIAGPAQYC